jgi:hypothetical protein
MDSPAQEPNGFTQLDFPVAPTEPLYNERAAIRPQDGAPDEEQDFIYFCKVEAHIEYRGVP